MSKMLLENDELSVEENEDEEFNNEPFLNYVVEVPSRKSKTRNATQKFLFAILLIVLVALIVFINLYVHQLHSHNRTKEKHSQKKLSCLSPACIESAAFMLQSLDDNYHPCNDMFQYSCGNWIRRNPIPDAKVQWSVMSPLNKQNLHVIKDALENLTTTFNEAQQKAKKFYQTCTNLKAIKSAGKKPLLDLTDKLGGFELDFKNSTIFSKQKFNELLLNEITVTGLTSFLSISVSRDAMDSSKNILYLGQKGLGLEYFNYKQNDTSAVLLAYKNYLVMLITKLYPIISTENATIIANETLKFERELFKIFMPPEEQITVKDTYHKITIKELQNITKTFNWLDYINHLLKGAGITANENEPLINQHLTYTKNIDTLLQRTDMRVIKNYMLVRVSSFFESILTPDFVHLTKGINIALYGTYEEDPRWKFCLKILNGMLSDVAASLFVKKAFTRQSFNEANTMVDALLKAMERNMQINTWMDENTKAAAEHKLSAINRKIGYPPYITDASELAERYKKLEFSTDKFANNYFAYRKWYFAKRLGQLREKPDDKRWEMSPAAVNAYYSQNKNEIVFPAGILQPPFFKAGYPKAVNYGSMGSIIGHEISHGFDNKGRLFDAKGNYAVKGWWSESSNEKFKELSKCYVDEYSEFIEAELHIKGNVTLAENLADNAGLKISFEAYKSWLKTQKEDEAELPALMMTNEQVFFVAYAQTWCTSKLKGKLIQQINTDTHSPAPDRVRGTLRNNKDFAKAFNCPVGSPMNPSKKCQLW